MYAMRQCILIPHRNTIGVFFEIKAKYAPEMVTGFQKKSNFKRRILRMKNYKKENEMKLIGGVALSMMLCIVTSTSIFAAGE